MQIIITPDTRVTFRQYVMIGNYELLSVLRAKYHRSIQGKFVTFIHLPGLVAAAQAILAEQSPSPKESRAASDKRELDAYQRAYQQASHKPGGESDLSEWLVCISQPRDDMLRVCRGDEFSKALTAAYHAPDND